MARQGILDADQLQGLIRRLSQVAFWSCVLAVAYLAFLPATEVPGLSWDKANHLLAFAVMTALAAFGWPTRRSAFSLWVPLLGYGLLIEIIQHVLPTREFSLLDWAADGLGILAALGLIALWRQ
ncbi:MAG: VanZ family protein, partial [Gammaproteobacteria bacterium]|nr:VanZ family protein [Gammaproteobacteria bacterium]